MRGALTMAWLAGLGLITWRSIAREHHPPIPGQMLAASGFFALLALVAEYEPAAGAAAAVAWGVDLAALLGILPASLAGPTSAAPATGPSAGPQNKGAAPTATGA